MRNLNVINLETACWIARLGSFTAAAERLYTTQPAVSARIRELEASLGIKLFLRQGRGVEPTIEGREFLRHVEPLLRKLDELSRSAKGGGKDAGVVRLGAGNICMSWFPELVKDLRQSMPQVTFDIEIERAARLLQRLEARKLDAAIVSGPVDAQKFHVVSLGYDRMMWVVAPALLTPGVPVAQFLHTVPLWCVQRESFYWSQAMNFIVELGANPANLNGISNMAAARQMVLGGAGVGLLARSLIQEDLDAGRLTVVPGLERGDAVELSIACPREDPQRLVLQIMDAAARISPFGRDRAAVAD